MPLTRSEQLAREALHLLCAHDLSAGYLTYARALQSTGGHSLPVALHADILDRANLPEAASRLRALSYQAGADPCAVPLWSTISPEDVLRGYEEWFARGCATAAMITHALIWLSRAGAATRLARLVAQADLLSVEALPVESIHLDALADCLTRLGQLYRSSETRSGRDLRRVPDLHVSSDPQVVALHAVVLERVKCYLDRVRAMGHLMSRHLPTRVALHSWANLSDGRGYHAPHIHTGCWVVAVAYIQAPSSAEENGNGCLCIGPSPDAAPHCTGWPSAQIAPRAGMLVLMPSFYTHWTKPHATGHHRLAVAFNVCNADDQFAEQE